jgi:hypothetical protein
VFRRSHKTRRGGLAIAILALLAAGCAGDENAKSPEKSPLASSDAPDDASFAAQWLAVQQARDGQVNWPPDGPDADAPVSRAAGDESYWTVVLGTYTGDGHEAAAANMLANLPQVAPQVGGASVHTSEKGSMVVIGRFPSPDDAAAQAELKRIRAITFRERPVFARAILSRVTIERGRPHPLDLRSARLRYPNVDPLYTLQVAAWSDFDSGELSLEEIQTSAESDARRLRGQGYEAYFHHDDTKRVSIVTVGLFGRDAIDPTTGLLSPDVDLLMKRFPQHLVNGEPLEVPIDPNRPRRGLAPQTPSLVAVPK